MTRESWPEAQAFSGWQAGFLLLGWQFLYKYAPGLETEAALQSVGLGVAGRGVALMVDDAGAHLHAEVFGNVEVG